MPRPSGWHIGTVVEAFPGAYNCSVKISGRDLAIPCMVLGQGCGFTAGTGTGSSWIPIETAHVLVFIPDPHGRLGYIVATIPSFVEQPDEQETRRWICPSRNPEPSTGQSTETAYIKPYVDSKYPDSVMANGGRPLDVLPGEQGTFNEMGLAHYMGTLAQGMRASERCGIDFFEMDDLVRLVSGQYQHYSAIGEHQIYNDGGYQTMEFSGSPHMCEALGFPTYDQNWLAPDKVDGGAMKNMVRKLAYKKHCLHRRFQMYCGHVSGLLSVFVAKPDPSIVPNQYDTKNRDQGLFAANVDQSGRLLVSSANDIILERTDRIPIPKKLHEPWDMEGDVVDKSDPFEIKSPFNWQPGGDPRASSLWLRDAVAWYKKLLYQRQDETPNDWFVPEEGDLRIPDNKFEHIDKVLGEEDYDKFVDRRCIFRMGKDGTITLRSEGGAEIVLAGADVQINAPGDIRLQSGQNVVVLGRDVFIKAKDSVDITATARDVRLKAEQNLHLYSEASVLIQTNTKSDAHLWDGKTKGEDQRHFGIAIEAKDSRVFIHGKYVHLAAISQLIQETLDTAKGYIIQATNRVLSVFNSLWQVSRKGAAVVLNNNAMVLGKCVLTIGDSGNLMIKDKKAAVITPWVDLETDPYQRVADATQPIVTRFLDTYEWLGSYTPEKRANIKFSHRTSEQMGTTDGMPVAPPDRKFGVFEGAWADMAASKTGPRWLPSQLEGWQENDVDGTYPWPGEAGYEGNVLTQLVGETNRDGHVLSKARKACVAHGGELKQVSMHEYRIFKPRIAPAVPTPPPPQSAPPKPNPVTPPKPVPPLRATPQPPPAKT